MGVGTWDDLVHFFEHLSQIERYSEHSKTMLSLIADLRGDPDFIDVIPGTGHEFLFFSLPGKKTVVSVWRERSGEITIDLTGWECSWGQTSVDYGDAITIIKEFLLTLREPLIP